ncbi:hypothetical protein FB561_4939 [Kribbella amoyensis]|uniref:Uncharacterized protein n=2 Tax=Kribbella amoyensis TaxID=996641 RepID=A0A561BY03_9ACTN|nr:hypothetical protein FB561_4939 [Kribbella amoyensis]
MAGSTHGRALAPMVLLLVLLAVVLLLLGSLGGLLVGILVSVLGTGLALAYLLVKLRRTVAANVLRLDGYGIHWEAGGGVVHQLAWPDLTGIGPVNVQLTPRRRLHVGPVPRSYQASMTDHGLHGWSMVTLPAQVPAVMRQALTAMPVDQASGKRHIGVPLASFDPSWPQGPIGAWIRAYRPDLLP